MRRLLWLPLLCLALTSSVWPQNDERILDYHSDITVNPDGSMDVRETIKVRVRGQQIKRGIYRDFPTTFRDRFGQIQRVGFHLREVTRNGQPDGSRIEDTGNQVRVYVGKADVLLPPGDYTYTLGYRSTHQLSYFPDHDELYWNVTGNGWVFAIDEASATVTLPPGVPARRIRLEGYTGPLGAKGQDFTSRLGSDGKSTFRTTTRLAPKSGLTIVVSFPKGFVQQPPALPAPAPTRAVTQPAPAAEDPAVTRKMEMTGGLGLLVLGVYYVLIWWLVGRDPEGGAIMPRYEPPAEFSPAAIRYLSRNEFDDRTFAAAVLNMAVKGHLTIRDEGGTFILTKKGENSAGLSPDEKAVSSHLMGANNTIRIESSNHVVIRSALQALEKSLRASQGKLYFRGNRLYLLPGYLLALAVLAAVMAPLFSWSPELALFMAAAYGGLATGACRLAIWAVRRWRDSVFADNMNLADAIVKSLLAVLVLALEAGLLWAFSSPPSSPIVVGLVVSIVGVNFLFYYLISAPTRAGRRALDHIEGFKMFLTAVDSDRLRMMGAVEKTPQLFDKYLPYALALDMEHQWAGQFSDVFARAAATPGAHDRDWYSISTRERPSPKDLASSFGRSFTRELAYSSAPPVTVGSGSRSSSSWGRSSGSGGRGSSGGGGGGGGGGGW